MSSLAASIAAAWPVEGRMEPIRTTRVAQSRKSAALSIGPITANGTARTRRAPTSRAATEVPKESTAAAVKNRIMAPFAAMLLTNTPCEPARQDERVGKGPHGMGFGVQWRGREGGWLLAKGSRGNRACSVCERETCANRERNEVCGKDLLW